MILPFSRSGKPKVRTILQSEASECGLTCLAMIANAHGHSVDLSYMRALHPVSRKGTTLADLYGLAPVFGLDARGLGIQNVGELSAVKLPAILHWEGAHFVVLEDIRGGRYVVHDPAVGRRVFDAADMQRGFSGVVLELEPKMALDAVVSARGGLRLWDVVRQFDGFGAAFSKILVVSLVVGLLTLATPILLQVALDFVLPQADIDLLGVLAIGLCALLLFDAVGRWLRDMIILRSSIGMQLQFSRSLIGHGFRLPLHYFESRHPGDVVTRMESIENVKTFAVDGLVRSLADAVMSILSVALMAYYSPSLTLVVLATLALALSVRLVFFGRVRRHTTESLVAKGDEAAVLLDGLSQVATLKAHNATTAYAGRWFEALSRFAGRDFLAHKVQIEAQLAVHLIVVIGTVLTLYLGVVGVIRNDLTIGMLYAFFALRTAFFDTADTLMTNLMQLSIVGAHVRRLEDMIQEPPESPARSATILRTIRSRVEVEDVTIRFGASERPVVEKARLSIDVAREERIAIVGESGSGKSSLLKVIASLAVPQEGAITVDGHSLARFGLLEYRNNIGAVFAGDGLIRGTLAENVALFNPSIGPDRIFRALDLVGLADEVDALPQGLATPLADESSLLSTGQRRRLLAARVICREPKLMMFDEMTANLDGATEERLLTNLCRLPGAKIFVTHSDRLLDFVDRAYRLKDGTVTEFDPRRPTGRVAAGLPIVR